MRISKETQVEFGKVIYDCCALAICLIFLAPVGWAIFSAFQPPR
jgi:hypothetical protein